MLDGVILKRFLNGLPGRGLKIATDNSSAFPSDALQEPAGRVEADLLRTRVGYPERNGTASGYLAPSKEEEVWLNTHETYKEARDSLGTFLDSYNTERIHSALEYIAPVGMLPSGGPAGLAKKQPELVLIPEHDYNLS